ncbi:hypothetical protein [Armatimonas rosea]|uniref:Cation transport ATPase n=1 Tax=Armatimonas rosea TaxID=685828 RepID=A0A7W9SWF9_ARMRO|nr:hypothetical protein [Armatimonas rosea]MBB6053620.1 cation transport ATPase [Armatimonas rosea]
MPVQQKRISATDTTPETQKVDHKSIVAFTLLQLGGIWCFFHIAGLRLTKDHGALTPYILASSLISATGGFVIFLAGLLTLLRQRQVAAWMLTLAALLQIVTGILAVANPVWAGHPYFAAWLNAGLSLLFATVFLILGRWLRWQEDSDR